MEWPQLLPADDGYELHPGAAVIAALFDLADPIITVRSLIRQACPHLPDGARARLDDYVHSPIRAGS